MSRKSVVVCRLRDSYVDAPYGKGFLSGGLIGCFHMSGLFVRYEV
ncbi:hypothetical protein predicted by Glimmer/Critica (plasmid) [Sinorhizobium fredii HH103]|nr:hypothetical protein predicted by Glimmer/Critica [Sinorhizobium fredii HH103]